MTSPCSSRSLRPRRHRPRRPAIPPLALLTLLTTGGCERPADDAPAPAAPSAAAPSGAARAAEGFAATPALAPDAVIAELGGEAIRVADVSPETAFRLYRAQVDLHALLAREAERLVAERVLARAARERGLDVEGLLAAEVDARVRPPTEAEVEAALRAEPPGAPVDAETARARVRTWLTERRRLAARERLEASLRERYGYALRLVPPPRPVVRIDVADAPIRGPDDAPVTVVLFGSLASPATADAAALVARLVAEEPGRVRFAFRHALSVGDERGLSAALLARFAATVGLFWPLYDRLTALGGAVDEATVRRAAEEVGLDLAAFEEARRAGRFLADLREELAGAARVGVDEPPALFVGGRHVHPSFGWPAVRAAFDEAERAASGGAERVQ